VVEGDPSWRLVMEGPGVKLFKRRPERAAAQATAGPGPGADPAPPPAA
jgi:hypothetical protein